MMVNTQKGKMDISSMMACVLRDLPEAIRGREEGHELAPAEEPQVRSKLRAERDVAAARDRL
jgi:hypothetical protein